MGITEAIKEKEGRLKPVKSFAEKLYEKQLNAIIAIREQEWFKEIKAYWERVRDSANIELQTIKKEHLELGQSKYHIANDFLTFLNNLETAKEIQERTKENT